MQSLPRSTGALRGGYAAGGLSLAGVVAARALATPDRLAWVDPDGSLTYAALAEAVHERAGRLPGSGSLVVHLDADRDLAVAVLAGLARGLAVSVVGRRSGGRGVAAALADSPGAALLQSRDAVGPDHLVVPGWGSGPTGGRAGPGRGTLTFSTSGTTGAAKSVRARTGLRAAGQLLGLVGSLPAVARPVVGSFASVDHGHGFGLLAGTLGLGGTFVSLSGAAVGRALGAVGMDRYDVLSGVPVQLADLADALDGGLSAPRVAVVLSGSDRLGESIAARLTRHTGAGVGNAYGATEIGTVCLATPRDRHRAPGTVGRPMPGVRVRVVDESGQVVPRGVAGRLVVRSPMGSGATFSGDRGLVDAAGFVHVLGRADGLRVSGGETVDPVALRDWLLAWPHVVAARVDSEPDDRFGSRLVATVVVRAGGVLPQPAALRAAAAAQLGPALVPRRVEVLTQDPLAPEATDG
ncbi:MAG: AMP-binding protein [Dermatophilaceae bacterium]